jgi:hypothetical protein
MESARLAKSNWLGQETREASSIPRRRSPSHPRTWQCTDAQWQLMPHAKPHAQPACTLSTCACTPWTVCMEVTQLASSRSRPASRRRPPGQLTSVTTRPPTFLRRLVHLRRNSTGGEQSASLLGRSSAQQRRSATPKASANKGGAPVDPGHAPSCMRATEAAAPLPHRLPLRLPPRRAPPRRPAPPAAPQTPRMLCWLSRAWPASAGSWPATSRSGT